MCPVCITTVALMVAGATSTGGLTMLAVKKLRAKGSAKNINPTTPNKGDQMDRPKVVSQAEWLAARKEFLIKEKELTRLRDQLSAERRELPWVKVEKAYVFDAPNGKETLADLFDGRSQLIVKHFMFGPGWKEGCVGCSFVADHIDGALVHLEHHDVTFVAVSRAPLPEIEAFKQAHGLALQVGVVVRQRLQLRLSRVVHARTTWRRARSSTTTKCGKLPSEELSGISVFYKDANGDIFHTYSSYARGGEMLLGTYIFLDMTPKGRNETGPNHDLTDWVRHHDRYDAGGFVDPTGRYVPTKGSDSCHGVGEDHV